jgi:hypothetical protein
MAMWSKAFKIEIKKIAGWKDILNTSHLAAFGSTLGIIDVALINLRHPCASVRRTETQR